MRKSILKKYKIFDSASLAANLISPVTSVEYLDSVCIQLQWETTTAEGTFAVEASIDGEYWTALSGINPVVSATNDHALINITLLPSPFIRVTYTSSAGTGTVNGYISAKMV